VDQSDDLSDSGYQLWI